MNLERNQHTGSDVNCLGVKPRGIRLDSSVNHEGTIVMGVRPRSDGMDDAERQKLIDRINRPSATIGSDIPETITVGEAEVPLEEFVIETRKLDGVPEELRPAVREAQRSLNAERNRLLERLKSEPIDRAEAEALADTIVGIDRARNALSSLRRGDFASEASSASLEDHKRWKGFLDAVRD